MGIHLVLDVALLNSPIEGILCFQGLAAGRLTTRDIIVSFTATILHSLWLPTGRTNPLKVDANVLAK